MKKYIAIWLCLMLLPLSAFGATKAALPLEISAESAVLMDAVSGKIIYEKRAYVRRPPASTTKIMTSILALENGDLQSTVTASVKASKTEFGSLRLKAGEQLTLENLMYAMLLRSANDAAIAVAEHIAGSESQFVAMMNEKSKEIGAKHTHFENPHGLYNPKHYSTAYDLALMAKYATRIPKFNELVSTRTKRIERSLNKKDEYLINTARFLWRFNGADGIKTGYTKEAGHCFVGSATRDGWRLIAVVLKSNNSGEDAAALLDYGFKNFQQVCLAADYKPVAAIPVKGGVVDKVDLLPAGNIAFILKRPANVKADIKIDARKTTSAPVEKGEKLGMLTGYMNGKKVGTVDLVAAETVERTLAATIGVWVRAMLTVSALFLVGYIAYGTATAKAARRRRCGF